MSKPRGYRSPVVDRLMREMASQDVTKDKIDMLDVVTCIIPAIMLCWLIIYQCTY